MIIIELHVCMVLYTHADHGENVSPIDSQLYSSAQSNSNDPVLTQNAASKRPKLIGRELVTLTSVLKYSIHSFQTVEQQGSQVQRQVKYHMHSAKSEQLYAQVHLMHANIVPYLN